MSAPAEVEDQRNAVAAARRPAPVREPFSWPEWMGHLPPASDPRHILAGDVILPGAYYADQPYVVKTADGAWLCAVTTGSAAEGERGQHVVSLRSVDGGKSWSEPVAIEAAENPESSWAVPFLAPGGRIFVFYVYNADDLRELPADGPHYPGGKTTRMDSHGHYVFRWSDDHGRSWSPERATIPVREFEIDRDNPTGGAVRLFWNVGRPLVLDGALILPLHKVGGFGDGWFTRSEGAFVRSRDLLAAADPAAASWETLPEGGRGLRTPPGGGPIAEEQSILSLSDGSLFAVYRSIDGHPIGAYSRDGGKSWSEPAYLAYENGRRVKHPRAACFAWKLGTGYVLWFHNHGGRFVGEHPKRVHMSYEDRNPVWMCRGREVVTPRGRELAWEAPEIALYDDDPFVRISYPDLVQEGDALFLTETQKKIARVHRVSPALDTALRLGPDGFDAAALRREAALDWTGEKAGLLPVLPALPQLLARSPEGPHPASDQRRGLTFEWTLDTRRLEADALLVDAWHPAFGGLRLRWLAEGSVELMLSDGRTEVTWRSDAGLLREPGRHHVVAVVDGGPKVVWFLVDGVFCDGAGERQFGWGRFSPHFRGLISQVPARFPSEGAVRAWRIYPRALLAAEARALRAGTGAGAGAR